MRKIEKRAVISLALAILLAAGMLVFLVKYAAEGGKWPPQPLTATCTMPTVC